MPAKPRVLICTAQAPFLRGGAETCGEQLLEELKKRGIPSEIIAVPFKWYPSSQIIKESLVWRMLDLTQTGHGDKVDIVIPLKFPAYGVVHPHKRVWFFHQHRMAYELWGTEFSYFHDNEMDDSVRSFIHQFDTQALGEAEALFTLSQRVSDRLKHFTGMESEPLYPPAPYGDRFHPGPYGGYIFGVSRLDKLKRMNLLVEAFRHTKSDAVAVIAGDGPDLEKMKVYVKEHGLEQKVKFTGRISDEERFNYFSRAFAVYFAPYDEDLGFVTQEAFLSEKPVLTADDSGAITELVVDGESGFVCQPTPEQFAEGIDRLFEDKALCERMGKSGAERVRGFSWAKVVEALVGKFDVL